MIFEDFTEQKLKKSNERHTKDIFYKKSKKVNIFV